MRAINLTNLGSGWVVSTPPSGGPYTRRVGTTGRGGRVPPGAHRQARVLYRLCAGGRRADRGELPHRGQGRGARGKHRQPAGAGAGRIARGGRVDRFGDQSSGAQFGRLPQCGPGDGAGSGRRERAVERNLQGKQNELCRRRVAGRRAAAECAFDQPERAGGGAVGEGELSGKLSRPGGVCDRLCQRLGRRPGHQDQRHGAGGCMAAGADCAHLRWPI